MDESSVVSHVVTHLRASGGRVWYNRRGLQSLPIETHEIAIGGWYPDVLCLEGDRRVLAVEAKRGGGDLARGLGQALLYQQGAHQTYLAAPAEDLVAVHHVALAHGIGLLSVNTDGSVQRTVPQVGADPRHLDEVQRELRILSARAGLPVRRLGSSALSLNHPLHYLVPVVLVPEGVDESTALATLTLNWTLGPGMAGVQLAGARLLGLLRADRQVVTLTDQGRLVRAMLGQSNSQSVPWSAHWAGVTQRREPLVDCSPIAGGILRFMYLQDPDVATLYGLLLRAGGALTMDQLMLLILRDAPNIALSLFCSSDGRPHLLELLQAGREELAASPSGLRAWFMARSRFQLKRQLIHVGLLAWETAHSRSTPQYDPQGDVWRLREH